jgi:hypothetical protein
LFKLITLIESLQLVAKREPAELVKYNGVSAINHGVQSTPPFVVPKSSIVKQMTNQQLYRGRCARKEVLPLITKVSTW